jgi:stress-induced morphogen
MFQFQQSFVFCKASCCLTDDSALANHMHKQKAADQHMITIVIMSENFFSNNTRIQHPEVIAD